MMQTGFSALGKQAATLQRQIHALRLARDAAKRPPKTAEELASDLGIQLDPWQQRAVATDAKDVLLLCGRQTGKSLVAADGAVS